MHLNSLVVADSLFLSQVIRRVSWKGPDADLNKCPFKLGSWLRSQYFYSINVQAQPTATLPLLTQAKTLNNSNKRRSFGKRMWYVKSFHFMTTKSVIPACERVYVQPLHNAG